MNTHAYMQHTEIYLSDHAASSRFILETLICESSMFCFYPISLLLLAKLSKSAVCPPLSTLLAYRWLCSPVQFGFCPRPTTSTAPAQVTRDPHVANAKGHDLAFRSFPHCAPWAYQIRVYVALFACSFQQDLLSVRYMPLLFELNVEVPQVMSLNEAPNFSPSLWLPPQAKPQGLCISITEAALNWFSFVQTCCHQSLLHVSPERAFQKQSHFS